MDDGRRDETPGTEIKNFIIHWTCSEFELVFSYISSQVPVSIDWYKESQVRPVHNRDIFQVRNT